MSGGRFLTKAELAKYGASPHSLIWMCEPDTVTSELGRRTKDTADSNTSVPLDTGTVASE